MSKFANYDQELQDIISIIDQNHIEIANRISSYYDLLLRNDNGKLREILKTNFILLLYSSFEGTIKKIANGFFDFLKKIKEKNKNIQFIDKYEHIISFHNNYGKFRDTEIKNFVSCFSNSSFIICNTRNFDMCKLRINTESNLKYETFIAILYMLNINADNFVFKEKSGSIKEEERANIIPKELDNFVDKRNKIAHGDELYIDDITNIIKDEELELYKELIKYLIDKFWKEVLNILMNEKFLIQENLCNHSLD